VALQQFELGTITSVELREVQEQFIEAESRLLTAQFEAKRAEVELLRLSGRLLDRMEE
jgi:outer membrane protein TolC